MKKKNILLFAVVFHIFLLATMLFANSYQIHQLDLIPTVSAEDSFSCCTKTKDGAICQDVTYDYLNCNESLIPTKCESVSECRLGCCVDEKEGLCTTASPRGKCEDEGGKWQDDKNCNTFECQKGCCVLGDNIQFITDKRCEQLSLIFGFEKDFRDLETQYECIALEASQPEGACVFEGGICKFTTESECGKLGGFFSEKNLCSKESLNTTCEKQASIGCFEGKDEIYWFDSCGNKENIYSSDKNVSWNKGEILAKEKSCEAGNSNANSKDCGNCNYFLGSRCSETSIGQISVKDGDFVCEDLNCVDESGRVRKNGESWCVYDSYIGDGKDTVGSRHWKRMCIEGEIKVEPCADYRGQICVQAEIENTQTNKNFSVAECVVNEATKCLNYNSKNDMTSCEKNEYCTIKNINVDSGFKFNVCVGKYPKGFDLTGKEYLESQDVCGMASQKCEVLYVKDWKGHWNCKNNCQCETSKFSKQMSDLCISLGDCGSYVNYIGDGTNNADVDNAPGVSWTDYKEYAKVNENQFAKPKKISQVLEGMNGGGSNSGGATEESQEASSFEKGIKLLGTISSATGTLISGISMFTTTSTITSTIGGATGGVTTTTQTASIMGMKMSGAAATTMGSVGAAASGVGIGMMVGSLAAKAFGIKGDAALALSIAGGLAGGIAGYGAFAYGAASTAAGGGAAGASAGSAAAGGLGGISTFGGALGPMLAALVWAIIIVIVLVIIIKIIGWGDTKIITVKFKCHPWEAPLGGSSCEKCNDDPLKPCSEYRCESLGQACKLLNENTENPICESIPNDNNPPIISFGETLSNFAFIQEGNSKTKIEEKGKKCITEFKPVLFSLDTDEPAQCKYSFEKTKTYEEMEQFPLEQNMFSENHTFAFSTPSVDSLNTYDTTRNISEIFEDMNMYVRCQDYHGNYNQNEYIVHFCINDGLDITPPNLVATNPRHNSYLKYGTKETSLEIFLNEPAECKIDPNDKIYEYLRTNMTCETDLLQYTDFGWKCSTTLTNLDEKENNFYIRCKDQPWLVNDTITIVNNVTNETTYKTRNVNTESFIFTLKGSVSELKIDSISPSGKISQGFEPLTIDLEVKTSGGTNKGEAACYYKFSESGTEALFFETYSNKHKQTLNSMMSGEYTIFIECKDDGGNVAKAQTDFVLNIDTMAPVVSRIYYENGEIKLITDEEAECYYDFNRCNFDVNNASSMTIAFSKKHSAEKISGQTYYIQCIDIWGNKGNGCSIKARTFD